MDLKMYLSSSNKSFAKLFYVFSVSGLFMYITLAFYSLHHTYKNDNKLERHQRRALYMSKFKSVYDMKYILLWTLEETDKEDITIEEGQDLFIKNKCPYTNCYLTTNKDLLNKDYTNFDAIIFNISVLKKWKRRKLPQVRSARQKYIFYGMEGSADNVICDVNADNYFNWTWSYKLYSDIFTPFIEVKDHKGNILAPDPNVEWLENMENLNDIERNEIKLKFKAVAWIISRCDTKTNRMIFANKLKDALEGQSLELDIYGCETNDFPNETLRNCFKAIDENYYFYLAYEDSISEDYVTKEVLNAYNYKAIPIVLGGADYSKFLPDGSYINARHRSTERLAALIDYIIRNTDVYYRYFRWRKYYSISESKQNKGFCELCDRLNSIKFDIHSSYGTFRKWWYPGSLQERCYPKSAESYTDLLSYMRNGSDVIRNYTNVNAAVEKFFERPRGF